LVRAARQLEHGTVLDDDGPPRAGDEGERLPAPDDDRGVARGEGRERRERGDQRERAERRGPGAVDGQVPERREEAVREEIEDPGAAARLADVADRLRPGGEHDAASEREPVAAEAPA